MFFNDIIIVISCVSTNFKIVCFVVSGIAYREQIRMDVRLLFLHNCGKLIVMQLHKFSQ